MDETGLFFKDSSISKTLHVKCSNGKHSKERITVELCINMNGDKEKPILIGKSQCPRGFGKLNIKELPVEYEFNKKAWMNSELFEKWLLRFDCRLLLQ